MSCHLAIGLLSTFLCNPQSFVWLLRQILLVFSLPDVSDNCRTVGWLHANVSFSLSFLLSLSLSRSLSPTVTCVLGVLGAQTNVRLQSLYNVTAKWKVGGASKEKKTLLFSQRVNLLHNSVPAAAARPTASSSSHSSCGRRFKAASSGALA